MSELVVQSSPAAMVADGDDSFEIAIAEIKRVKDLIPHMTADDVLRAAVWAEAVSAATRAKRAWAVAREASEMRIRAERRLGQLIAATPAYRDPAKALEDRLFGVPNAERINVDYKKEGAFLAIGKIPHELFEKVIIGLLDREKSVDPTTVLRCAHRESLERIEPGIAVAWDGTYFLDSTDSGQIKRATSRDLDRVREELHALHRLSRRQPRAPVAVAIDEAFAKARRDAQALNALGEGIHGEAGRLIADAELLQAQVASLLFDAYRVVTVNDR